jgi:hypothetical protein
VEKWVKVKHFVLFDFFKSIDNRMTGTHWIRFEQETPKNFKFLFKAFGMFTLGVCFDKVWEICLNLSFLSFFTLLFIACWWCCQIALESQTIITRCKWCSYLGPTLSSQSCTSLGGLEWLSSTCHPSRKNRFTKKQFISF